MHAQPYPLQGLLTLGPRAFDPQGIVVPGARVEVEDWWDRMFGDSWKNANGNPAAMQYGLRAGLSRTSSLIRSSADAIPWDDEVVYGKIDKIGYLIHVVEISEDEARRHREEQAAIDSIRRSSR